MNRDEYIQSLVGGPNRYHPDPWDLTRYFVVRDGVVRERECPPCRRNPVICPEGKLRWDQAAQTCRWADEVPRVVALAEGEHYSGE